jgi:hypothetical protein
MATAAALDTGFCHLIGSISIIMKISHVNIIYDKTATSQQNSD